ncbi:zinc-binding dehydrogenase family protein [Nannochloropsis gaditana]|uniref:Zinc-binding dehydrogenase family protein n=1 Tax=Nannochloropsis gaditana TaxID=72520 RepID=W7T2K5_9STRA|nr:zinc-binding dehydrogenase family protein [Nannochloropsis gaditana]
MKATSYANAGDWSKPEEFRSSVEWKSHCPPLAQARSASRLRLLDSTWRTFSRYSGSFIPGLEYSGVVDALGPPDTTSSPFPSSTIKAGDPVYGFTRFGAYASHLNVPLAYVRPLPSSFSFAQGAAFIVQGLTAWHAMIELGNLKKGQTVLVHSAAGGVGCFALEICAKFQAFPIATIGSETKRAFLQSRFGLNDGQIVVREKEDRKFARQLKDAVRGKSGRNRVGERARGSHEMQEKEDGGFDLILDALGGMYFKEGYKQLARGGRMITFGAADYLSPTDGPNWWKIIPRYLTRPRLDPGDMCAENRGVLGFNLIW